MRNGCRCWRSGKYELELLNRLPDFRERPHGFPASRLHRSVVRHKVTVAAILKIAADRPTYFSSPLAAPLPPPPPRLRRVPREMRPRAFSASSSFVQASECGRDIELDDVRLGHHVEHFHDARNELPARRMGTVLFGAQLRHIGLPIRQNARQLSSSDSGRGQHGPDRRPHTGIERGWRGSSKSRVEADIVAAPHSLRARRHAFDRCAPVVLQSTVVALVKRTASL